MPMGDPTDFPPAVYRTPPTPTGLGVFFNGQHYFVAKSIWDAQAFCELYFGSAAANNSPGWVRVPRDCPLDVGLTTLTAERWCQNNGQGYLGTITEQGPHRS